MGPYFVRLIAALVLTGLIAACPVLCGADEVGHGMHAHDNGEATPSPHPSGGHCPDDGGDNCICQGAVQSADVRLPGSFDLIGLPLLSAALLHTPPHPLNHLTRAGTPTGLAGLGDSLAVRAFLQNFRC